MEKVHPKQAMEGRFDASHAKMTKFLRNKPTFKKLKKFMKDNPGLIVYVSKERAKAAHKKLEEYMKTDPVVAQVLREKAPRRQGEKK